MVNTHAVILVWICVFETCTLIFGSVLPPFQQVLEILSEIYGVLCNKIQSFMKPAGFVTKSLIFVIHVPINLLFPWKKNLFSDWNGTRFTAWMLSNKPVFDVDSKLSPSVNVWFTGSWIGHCESLWHADAKSDQQASTELPSSSALHQL